MRTDVSRLSFDEGNHFVAVFQQMGRLPFQVDIKALAPDTTDASRDAVVRAILAGQASDATRETLARAETPQHLLALTLGSPEFQRR